ncbi:uncharacterized protein LOC120697721 [Panicum virgatum]|uniref:uncharacterized protein LOC120697721 n=1 Tax=Panicum virgatum TaxID=38727 RepID=UPI0019D590BF|nr:uncharacterized protein LOC120697721 [Panicum virgatum]
MAGAAPAPGQAGALLNHRKRKALAPAAEDEAEELEREVEELESELADLDRHVLEHLRGTAKRVPDAVASCLTALLPSALIEVPTVSETSIVEDDQEQLEKLRLLKLKMEANIATLPKVLERMNESVAQCEKLESLNVNIHPIF